MRPQSTRRARSILALFPRVAAALGLAGALALAAGAHAETPKIYKWVDSNGIAHYTTDPKRIPKALRDRIHSVERSRPIPAEPAVAETTDPAPAEVDPTRPLDAETPIEAVAGPEVTPTAPEATVAAPDATAAAPSSAAPTIAASPAPAPAPATTRSATSVAPPTGGAYRSGDDWFDRNALPRAPSSSILATGRATPEQLEALAREQQALDARIEAVLDEIARDENFLKGLISDPQLDSDVPLFDRPEFLEVSQRLPELQARLQELRDERAKLETP